MKSIEETRNRFSGDKYAVETTGIVIDEAEKGRAVCSLILEDKHRNIYGSVMGGVIFTLGDFAFAVASNFDEPRTVLLSSSITFLRPAVGKKLTAEAKCLRSGRSTCFFLIEVFDDNGKTIASISSTGSRKSED